MKSIPGLIEARLVGVLAALRLRGQTDPGAHVRVGRVSYKPLRVEERVEPSLRTMPWPL
jgi:hypothetical protein